MPEVTAQHLGYIGLAEPKQIGGLDLLKAALFGDRIDLEHELRLDEVFFRLRHTEVLENIAASRFVSFFAHGFTSFAILLGLAHSLLDQLDVPARCLSSCLRFFLEGVKDIHRPSVTQGVYRAECIAALILDDFHDPAPPKPMSTSASYTKVE